MNRQFLGMLFGGLSGNKMENSNCSNADNDQKYLNSSYDKQNLKWRFSDPTRIILRLKAELYYSS